MREDSLPAILERHRQQRRQRIPGLTWLVGTAGATLAAARTAGFAPAPLSAPDAPTVFGAWLDAARAAVDLEARALQALGVERGASGPTPEELRARLDARFPTGAHGGPGAALRWLLLGTPDFLQLPIPERLTALRELGPALPAVALLVPERWGAEEAGASLCTTLPLLVEAVPDLMLAVCTGPVATEALGRAAPSRLRALLERVPVEPPRLSAEALAALPPACHTSAAVLLNEGAPTALTAQLVAAAQELETGDTERARSAAERFLFDMLESLPDTAGRFVLNSRIPVPRVPHGPASCEVDLLDTSDRIALEVDGYFHFRDAEAYRRDRRKDLALQRAGYRVLRFLADDVVSHLEHILSTLRSELAERRPPPKEVR